MVEHRPLKEDPGFWVGKECGQLRPDAFRLSGGHEVAGGLPEHLLRSVAEDLPALRADIGERAGLVHVQDQVVDVLDKAPEERLALAQGFLRPSSLGDILKDDGDPRCPVVEDGGEELDPEEEFLSVPQEPELFHDLTAVERVGDPALYQRMIERGQL